RIAIVLEWIVAYQYDDVRKRVDLVGRRQQVLQRTECIQLPPRIVRTPGPLIRDRVHLIRGTQRRLPTVRHVHDLREIENGSVRKRSRAVWRTVDERREN